MRISSTTQIINIHLTLFIFNRSIKEDINILLKADLTFPNLLSNCKCHSVSWEKNANSSLWITISWWPNLTWNFMSKRLIFWWISPIFFQIHYVTLIYTLTNKNKKGKNGEIKHNQINHIWYIITFKINFWLWYSTITIRTICLTN